MLNLNNLNEINSLGAKQSVSPWYKDVNLLLNNIPPAFVHKYDLNRYYNTTDGETSFPFDIIRNTNAWMYDSQGRLVAADANMLARSQPISNGIWSPASAVATGGQFDPFGGTTGVNLIVNNGVSTILNDSNGCSRLSPNLTVISGATYTVSFYAKANQLAAIRVREPVASGARALINLSTGSITNEAGNTSSITAGMLVETENIGDGWWRIYCTRRTTSAVFNIDIKGGIDIGDGVSGVYISSVMVHPYDGIKKRFIETTGTAKYCKRMDYDPETLVLRGLLVEPQQTNQMLKSSSNVPAEWSANQTSYTTAADQWTFPVIRAAVASLAASQFAYIAGNTLTATLGSVYAVSAFIKKDNHRYIQLTTSANYTPGAWVNYDFDTNTFTENGPGSIIAGSAHAQLLQDGWVRLQFAFTATVAASGAGVILGFINGLADARLTTACTNASAAVFTFGHQVENNWMATSHIPTYGVTTTRNADQPTITSFPWLDPAKQTWFVRGIVNLPGVNARRLLDVSDGTSSVRLQLTRSAANTTVVSNATFAPTTTANSTAFTEIKSLMRINATNRKITTNNSAVVTDATGITPLTGFTQINIGHIAGYTPGNCPCMWIREVICWNDDTASDAQLQAKTA